MTHTNTQRIIVKIQTTCHLQTFDLQEKEVLLHGTAYIHESNDYQYLCQG